MRPCRREASHRRAVGVQQDMELVYGEGH
jgi:hypothetical protein